MIIYENLGLKAKERPLKDIILLNYFSLHGPYVFLNPINQFVLGNHVFALFFLGYSQFMISVSCN
jgi:hypothetical protein